MILSSRWVRHLLLASAALAAVSARPAAAYSVLSHEEVVDMAWTGQIVPLLRARFPGITADQLREAHAYAYGGSVIQDIGYYPFGSAYFSDLLHYVRSGDFVVALIRDSTTPDEYAFALGALAHFCGDAVGHPVVNLVTAQENPKLEREYGPVVTYGEDHLAHVRTEFGFDVAQVVHGHYSQENYRDFIGFQVSRSLLDQAFEQTYGLHVEEVMPHEDLAIKTYRRAVSSIIPRMTKIAYYSDRKEIEQANPGMTRRKFMYRLDQTQYAKDFGKDGLHLNPGEKLLGFVIRLIPSIGPLSKLKVTIPTGEQQTQYLKSINDTVDRYRGYLGQIHAQPAPLPTLSTANAASAADAAARLADDAKNAQARAAKTDSAQQQEAAQKIQAAADRAAAVAQHTAAHVQAVQAAVASGAPAPLLPGAVPAGSPIEPPDAPALPPVDLDTGKLAHAGEYELADQTWARLLDDLVRPAVKNSGTPAGGDLAGHPVLVAQIQAFFSNPQQPNGPVPDAREARKRAALQRQVQDDLALLRGTPAAEAGAQ